MTTTPRSKGKMYQPVKHTGGDRRGRGARVRSIASKTGSNKKRDIFHGYKDLSALANLAYEHEEPNYSEQENKLFEVNTEIKALITEMESKETDGKTQA